MSELARALSNLDMWAGSLNELVATASKMIDEQRVWGGRVLRAPTRPVVLSYRNFKILSTAQGKRFFWRHLVELVVACVLIQSGESRNRVATRFRTLEPVQILALLNESQPATADVSSQSTAMPKAESRELALAHELVPLLAAGLVDQYRQARSGHLLIHDSSLSRWLQPAMSRLAALFVVEGKVVEADGAHTIVAKSCEPLDEPHWGLDIFNSPDFRYHGIRLLDAGNRLPTIECVELARDISSELDLLEQQAFARLESTCDQFASRADEVYSLLREFITRHPITTSAEQRKFLEEHKLLAAEAFLASCYETVQPHHMIKGVLLRCTSCGAPMAASVVVGHASCATRQCKSFEAAVPCESAKQSSLRTSLVAKAHILAYWCGPGQDEIALYDAARKGPGGARAALYPGRDKCDVSIDGDVVGIDVKSHASPFLLAASLNRGIGKLELFASKVIAINDQALSRFPNYLEILRREFRRLDVELISVSALRRQVKVSS